MPTEEREFKEKLRTIMREYHRGMGTSTSYYIICSITAYALCYMLYLRGFELFSFSSIDFSITAMVPCSILATLSLFISPPTTFNSATKRIALVIITICYSKTQMDGASKVTKAFDRDATLITRVSQKTALVTGTDKSLLSLELAKSLARSNCVVIATCESDNGCLALRSSFALTPIQAVQVDFSDLRSVKRFANELLAKSTVLDYIVLNPYTGYTSGSKSVQGYEMSFGTSYLSNFLLTQSLSPIINSSSVGVLRKIVTIGDESFAFAKIGKDISDDIRGEKNDNMGKFMGIFPGFRTRINWYNGAARAHLANLFHMQSIARRNSNIKTAFVSPGTWDTGISNKFFSPIVGLLVKPLEKAIETLIYALVVDDYVNGAFIDATGQTHDLMLDLSPDKLKFKEEQDKERVQQRGTCIKNCVALIPSSLSNKEKKDQDMQCRYTCLEQVPHVPRILGMLSSYRMWLYPSDAENVEVRDNLWKLSEDLVASCTTAAC